MSYDYQPLIDSNFNQIQCYGRAVVVDGDNTHAIFCKYKEEKLRKWLTIPCFNEVCISPKLLNNELVRGSLIVDGAKTWYVMDPGKCEPGAVIICYKAKVCENRFTTQISIQDSEIDPVTGGRVDANKTFTEVQQVMAMVETIDGYESFDDVGQLAGVASHLVTFPYISGIHSQQWVKIGSIFYDILKVENLNEANKFTCLWCSETGPDSNSNNEL